MNPNDRAMTQAAAIRQRSPTFVTGLAIGLAAFVGVSSVRASDRSVYEAFDARVWRRVFHDPCTKDWRTHWFLDGAAGAIKTGSDGMELSGGPEFKNDSHNMVLWTKDSFAGDLKVSYEYTRLDSETRCVNILYLQATGSGEGPYVKDIGQWRELRRVPAMQMYYDHMHAYHISYAAFPNSKDVTSYIRGRRYMPGLDGLKGTELRPDHFPVGLFKTGVTHRIDVIKTDRDLAMRVKTDDATAYFHMRNDDLPIIREGRVGLRHMFTRSARYRDVHISVPGVADSAMAAESDATDTESESQ